MLKKILDAILGYLSWLVSKKELEEDPIIISDPDPEDAKPQDGSDVPSDSTTVKVITDLEEVLVPDTIPEVVINPDTIPPVPETTTTFPPPPPEIPPVIEQPEEPPIQKANFLWCLDNGHGKLTAGKRSPKLKNGERFYEYEFNRDIVRRIIDQLEDHGLSYYNVVPEVEVDNFLQGRVLRSNNHPSQLKKIFVSIHSNAGNSKWTSASGIETWFFYRSRTGAKIAAIFQKHLVDHTKWTNRGIKSRANQQFYVLKNTSMPAVLTENGFFNNEKQVYELMKPSVRQK